MRVDVPVVHSLHTLLECIAPPREHRASPREAESRLQVLGCGKKQRRRKISRAPVEYMHEDIEDQNTMEREQGSAPARRKSKPVDMDKGVHQDFSFLRAGIRAASRQLAASSPVVSLTQVSLQDVRATL